ncbi:MAG: AraC family transcriptional regulator [Sphingobacteriia bacterium]|nr:AraC family transcriptional regulator [Sphingobacteriia bacterium]
MPEVKFYKPDDHIKWMVRKFEMIKSTQDDLQLTDNFIPRPDIAMVFHFGSLPRIIYPVDIELKPLTITVISDRPVKLSVDGKLDSFIAICNATVLSKILHLNLNIKGIKNVGISDERFTGLWEKMDEMKSNKGRIKIFSEEIQKIAGDYQFDQIDRIYFEILENSMGKSLQKITENICLTKSTLNRNFLKRTGVSMKKLIRIARVHSIFERMIGERRSDCRELFYQSNYYDQSHFIKDFRAITGFTPKHFFKVNSALCKILSGMDETNPNSVAG